MPSASAACEPGDRCAQERCGSRHESKDHGCTPGFADIVARLRDDAVDAPFSIRSCKSGLSGGESDEIVPIVRRDTRMASTGQQNAAGLGAGISDVRVLRTSLRAKKAIEIVAWWRGRSP